MRYQFTTRDQAGHLDLAREATGSEGFLPDAKTLAAYDAETNDLVVIVVFENETTIASTIHFAAIQENWATQRLLRALFTYAFKFKASRRLRAMIPRWNIKTHIMALKSGFMIDGILRAGAADGSDAIVMSLELEDCVWLPPDVTQDHAAPIAAE